MRHLWRPQQLAGMQNDMNCSCDVIGHCPSFWSSCIHACIDVNFFSIGKNFSTTCNKHMLERSCFFWKVVISFSFGSMQHAWHPTSLIVQELAGHASFKLSAAEQVRKAWQHHLVSKCLLAEAYAVSEHSLHHRKCSIANCFAPTFRACQARPCVVRGPFVPSRQLPDSALSEIRQCLCHDHANEKQPARRCLSVHNLLVRLWSNEGCGTKSWMRYIEQYLNKE